VKKHIISRAEYKQIIKQLNPGIQIVEEEELSLLKQEQKPIVTEPQEKATILVRVFGRKTSVLFDVQTLTEMFTADNQSDEMKEMISQTIFIALATIKQNIVANQREVQVFRKYWELCTTSLSLAKLNEMIQANRDSQRIIEPLLKCAVLLGP
jgi:hypothetical protein